MPGPYTFDVSEGDITINDAGESVVTVTYGSPQTTTAPFPETQEITFTGTTTTYSVKVESGVTANITLNSVSINKSSGCAFDMTGATVNLTLVGLNILTSGSGRAGLEVPSGATLTVGGVGELTVTGGWKSAGIGGSNSDFSRDGGTITIEGGTVKANSGDNGAGIGGGHSGAGGTITISNGTVTARSSLNGAGIGGGWSGNSGIITIEDGTVTANGGSGGAGIGGSNSDFSRDGGNITIGGGTVTANGGTNAPGIGGGYTGLGGTVYIFGGSVKAVAVGGSAQAIGHGYEATYNLYSGTLQNNNTDKTPVYLTTVTLENVSVATAVYSLTTDPDVKYGIKDMQTDDQGKLYLYLPENTLTTAAETNSGTVKYKARTGEIKTNENHSAAGTLYLVTTSSGGGGGSSTPVYRADVSGGGNLPITVNQAGDNASVNISEQLGSSITAGGNEIITMPTIPGVSSYTLGIPVAYLSTPGGGTLTFRTGTGSITLPADMMAGIPGAAGKKTGITIGVGDKSSLPEDVKNAIGNRPLIDISLTLDGKQTNWNNPDAPVTVSIPYTPTAEELANPESIVVWYINGSGNAVCVPNGRYDPVTGTVTFDVTHFSRYAVAYNRVRFIDVPTGAWYEKAISFIAAREITTGTGEGRFSPEAKLTRGEFIVMLMKAYEIAPDTNPIDNFSDAGNIYYTGYLAAAKRLGITSGIGNNMYAPGKEITHQEMFTLLYNALKVMWQLPKGDSGRTLSDFTDSDVIAPWAKDAMALLVKTDTISGSYGKLTPQGTTTRAEMAQVLYNLLGK